MIEHSIYISACLACVCLLPAYSYCMHRCCSTDTLNPHEPPRSSPYFNPCCKSSPPVLQSSHSLTRRLLVPASNCVPMHCLLSWRWMWRNKSYRRHVVYVTGGLHVMENGEKQFHLVSVARLRNFRQNERSVVNTPGYNKYGTLLLLTLPATISTGHCCC